jgi:7-cyano-7-deazaguanine synthase in queuosine biosynthesis
MLCSRAGLMFHPDEIVKLLWTGGWDSTFRLLDLVLVRDVCVQPFYVLDTARRSSIIELETMQRIRRSIAAISPAKAQLVSPSTIYSIHDIAADPKVTARYMRLKARSFLGEQYDWLARFVDQFNLPGLELCVHVDDKAHAWLAGHVEEVHRSDRSSYWVLRQEHGADDLSLFAPFRFPLLTLTKTDMQRIAAERGFLHIMEQTWFCFTPVRNRPCGVCNPCQYAIQEGMGDRLPRAAKIRHFFLPVSRPFRRMRDKVARLAAASW